jgi:hypothetical protein
MVFFLNLEEVFFIYTSVVIIFVCCGARGQRLAMSQSDAGAATLASAHSQP